ncbi:MAG: SirB2 family protein [Porticoccus sp.]|nr:SirB2 family protein [Porticoccus sp.]
MEGTKQLHIACALLSGGGFFFRGILMAQDSALLQTRVIKIETHIVYTALLISEIILE